MLHTILITLHAASAIVAFVLGVIVLRPPAGERNPAIFSAYLGALWSMILFLLLAVAFDWLALALFTRILFVALVALAIYMGWRGWQAWEVLRHRKREGWRTACIDGVASCS